MKIAVFLALVLGTLCVFQHGVDANKLSDLKKYLRKLPDKLKSQLDRGVGNNVIRTDKKGGAIFINRRGHILEFKLLNLAEMKNKTEHANIAIKDIDFTITKDKNDTRYGVDSAFLEVEGVLPQSKGNVTIQMFMFREDGVLTGDDGNEYDVLKGGTKVNIEINWANPAEAIDMHLGMKCDSKKSLKKAKFAAKARGRKGQNSKSKKEPKTMAICDKARVTFSPSYTADNTNEVDMDDDYPLAGDVDANGYTIVKLRFAGRRIVYDPVMEVGDDVDASDSATNGSVQRSCQGLTLAAAILFSIVKFFVF